jgi:hypothetical protein
MLSSHGEDGTGGSDEAISHWGNPEIAVADLGGGRSKSGLGSTPPSVPQSGCDPPETQHARPNGRDRLPNCETGMSGRESQLLRHSADSERNAGCDAKTLPSTIPKEALPSASMAKH